MDLSFSRKLCQVKNIHCFLYTLPISFLHFLCYSVRTFFTPHFLRFFAHLPGICGIWISDLYFWIQLPLHLQLNILILKWRYEHWRRQMYNETTKTVCFWWYSEINHPYWVFTMLFGAQTTQTQMTWRLLPSKMSYTWVWRKMFHSLSTTNCTYTRRNPHRIRICRSAVCSISRTYTRDT